MVKRAHIEGGVVVNISVVDVLGEGEIDATCARIGDQWNGAQFITLAPAPRPAAEVIREIQERTQQRLDDFAKTRLYDGILSACTYADSPTPKFATEGQYCVARRDATWVTLHAIMAAVEAAQRPMPACYAEIEAELPALEWPQ